MNMKQKRFAAGAMEPKLLLHLGMYCLAIYTALTVKFFCNIICDFAGSSIEK
jgi:hypothetical protein